VKNFFKGILSVAVACTALSTSSHAQTVAVNGLGSSAIFLELGLATLVPVSGGVNAQCVWSENTNSVIATDTTVGTLQDKGSAWVAWTKGSGTCDVPTSPIIAAYLQTDSLVGNRCLFHGASCKIGYPTTNPTPANLIGPSAGVTESSLPVTIANALNAAAVNTAGTDIRPEDAEFAVKRAVANCNTTVGSAQYLGLGYTNGTTIASDFDSSTFNVLDFTLPSSYTVTPVGATPVLVVVNGDGTTNGFGNPSITNLTSPVLANFLDGTYSFTGQALPTPVASGPGATVVIREPLSGTYNTMEYNVPNTLTLQTSQDVGFTQPIGQKNCSGTVVGSNPMHLAGTASGSLRRRAIGTGQALTQVRTNTNSLGYGFWSVANFSAYASAPNAKYLKVDGVDPLMPSTVTYTGVIPTTGTTNMANVNLENVANGTYPIWSMLRLVTTSPIATVAARQLATSAQTLVPTGTPTSRPDFVQTANLTVVRSHFIPPAGSIQPATAANGHVGLTSSACTATEAGGDVGGRVLTLSGDSAYCTANSVTTGQTGLRR
jgi:hypothetical protein